MSTKIPLGIFWDIENCAIPSNKSVSSCVKQIRDFIADKRQLSGFAKEFCCACDVFNLGKSLSEGLDKNGVNVLHVNNTAKNAAEDKLQKLIDMFIDKYGGTGSAVLCIISSDINLAKQIRNARRKDLDVILIHGINCSVDLKNLVNEYHLYEDIIKRADNRNETDGQISDIKPAYLEISNLPIDEHFDAIKKRLTDLSANCGGKPECVVNGKGFIRFGCLEDAQRCLPRINGRSVSGSKILVKLCNKPNIQSTEQKTTDSQTDRKSVIVGLNTIWGQNVTELVKNLVSEWKNIKILHTFIERVDRDRKFNGKDGFSKLIVTATSAENSKALVSGAHRYLSGKGVKWFHSKPSVTKVKTVGSPLKTSRTRAANKSHKKDTTSQITVDMKSVIYGFQTKTDQNLATTVQKLVMKWKDREVQPNYIYDIIRYPGYPEVDWKSPLLVMANSEKYSKALVSGAAKHLKPNEGIVWIHLKSDQKLKEKLIPKQTEITDKMKTEFEIRSEESTKSKTTVELSAQFSDKSAKHQKLDDVCAVFSPDIESVIYGFDTKIDQNLAKIVRKLVMEWNDREVQPNYIKDVMRFPGYPEVNGKSPLLVIANSEKYNKALVSGAAKHLNPNEGIVWTHLKSDRKLVEELIPKPTEVTEKLDSEFGVKTEESIKPKSDQKLVENPIPKPLEVTVKEETEFVVKPEESTKPKTTVRVKPMLNNVLSVDNKSKPTLPYIRRPIPRSERLIPEPVNLIPEQIPRVVSTNEKNIFKSLITGFEVLFKSKKSKPVPNNDSIQNPTVPFHCSIGNIIKSGLIIHFSGRINTGPHEGFTLEFRADSDVAFHFDVRLTQLLVVRNAKTNGNWGHEERQYRSHPFVLGQDFNAMIKISDLNYMVYINSQHFCDFEHRIPLNRVNNLSIFGDITIHWLRIAQI